MPILPRYNGPISSSAVAYGPGAKPSLLDTLANGRGDFFGSALGRLFYDPEQDPRAQQAGLYKAQRDKELYETGRLRNADTAASDFGRDSKIVSGFRTPTTPVDETQKAIAYAYQDAISKGADPKQITPLLQAFALSLGGDASDQLGVRVNSTMEGKYLGKDQSPSLARQDLVREDEQQADADIEQGKRTMEKYGFDTQASTSRANNSEDNATSRANNASTVGATMRGQNLDSADRRRSMVMDAFTSTFNNERGLQGGDGKAVTRVERGGDGKVTKRVDQVTKPVRPARGGGGGDKPPVAGAKKAPDGNWYVNDPKRPGKYLKVG